MVLPSEYCRIVKHRILQAVQGKPPNMATGRVGAVGQIHLICSINFKKTNGICLSSMHMLYEYWKNCKKKNAYPYIWKRKIFQELRTTAKTK